MFSGSTGRCSRQGLVSDVSGRRAPSQARRFRSIGLPSLCLFCGVLEAECSPQLQRGLTGGACSRARRAIRAGQGWIARKPSEPAPETSRSAWCRWACGAFPKVTRDPRLRARETAGPQNADHCKTASVPAGRQMDVRGRTSRPFRTTGTTQGVDTSRYPGAWIPRPKPADRDAQADPPIVAVKSNA